MKNFQFLAALVVILGCSMLSYIAGRLEGRLEGPRISHWEPEAPVDWTKAGMIKWECGINIGCDGAPYIGEGWQIKNLTIDNAKRTIVGTCAKN
jgi:hypothetical protein